MAVQMKADWTELNVAELHPKLQEAYKAYKDVYSEMKRIRAGFEAAMNDQSGLPDSKRLVFGYNFGKLSVAVVDAAVVKPKAKAPQSLSAFLQGQMNGGRRA